MDVSEPIYTKVPEPGYTVVTEPGCTIIHGPCSINILELDCTIVPGPCSANVSEPGYIDVHDKIYTRLPEESLTRDNPGPLQWMTGQTYCSLNPDSQQANHQLLNTLFLSVSVSLLYGDHVPNCCNTEPYYCFVF